MLQLYTEITEIFSGKHGTRMWVERERSGHISFIVESTFLKIALAQYAQRCSLNPKCHLLVS